MTRYPFIWTEAELERRRIFQLRLIRLINAYGKGGNSYIAKRLRVTRQTLWTWLRDPTGLPRDPNIHRHPDMAEELVAYLEREIERHGKLLDLKELRRTVG